MSGCDHQIKGARWLLVLPHYRWIRPMLAFGSHILMLWNLCKSVRAEVML